MKETIYHVHVNATGADHYFGSMVAIFDHLSPDDIGVDLATLQAWKRSHLSAQYKSELCVIKCGVVLRTPQNRTIKRLRNTGGTLRVN